MTAVTLNATTRRVEVLSSARDVQARAGLAALAAVATSGDASDLAGGGYSLATLAALEAAHVPPVVAIIRVLGHTAAGDGGQHWRVRGDDVAEAVQSADGAWWERVRHSANVLAFGARGSGLNADADANTTAFDACVSYLKNVGGGMLLVPAGAYYKGRTWIRDAQNIHILGEGRGATKLVLRDSPDANQAGVLHFGDGTNETRNCSVSRLEIDGNLDNQEQSEEPGESNLGLSVQRVDGFVGHDLYIHDCDGYGVGLSGTGHSPRQDVTIDNVEVARTNGDAIDLKGGAQRFLLSNIRARDTLESPRGAASIGIDLRGRRLNLSNFWVWNVSDHTEQQGVRVRVDNDAELIQTEINISDGFVSDCPRGYTLTGGDTSWGSLSNCWALNSGGHGLVHNGGHWFLSNCHIHGSGLNGIRSEATAKQLVMHGGSIRGSVQDGIGRAEDGAEIELHGVDVSDNTRHGLNLVGSGPLKVFGGCYNNNGSMGVRLLDFSSPWLFVGTTITGNTAADIQYSGTVTSGAIIATDYGTVSGTVPAGTFDTSSFSTFGAGLIAAADAAAGRTEMGLGTSAQPVFRRLNLRGDDGASDFNVRLMTTGALTSTRNIFWNVNNGHRIITLTGDPTLADWFDQGVKTTSSPTFAEVGLGSVTVSTLPSAFPAGKTVYVSNEAGGAVLAFSDGTNWRRVTDRAVVS